MEQIETLAVQEVDGMHNIYIVLPAEAAAAFINDPSGMYYDAVMEELEMHGVDTREIHGHIHLWTPDGNAVGPKSPPGGCAPGECRCARGPSPEEAA
jgi:hypothetical protein